jgi:hypothetical protein
MRVPILRLVLLIGCLLFGKIPAADAQLLDYHTFGGYGLAKGILGNDYTQPLPACITGDQTPLSASHADVRVSIVYSAYQYQQAFHIDQKAQASYLEFGGGDELHIGRETGSSGSAFDIIVEAYGEHDANTINNIQWSPPYKSMIESGDPQKIATVRLACGDRYIETVFNETRLFVVLHVSSQQNSSLTSFSLQTNAKFGIDAVSASGSLGGDANIRAANQSGAISMGVYSEGLGGIIPTAGAIGLASSDGLVDISNKVSNYLGTLHDTGQPVKYQLAPLPGIQQGQLSSDRIFDYLNDFKTNYSRVGVRLANVTALLAGDQRRVVFKQPQADNALRNQKHLLSRYADAVAEAHDGCRKGIQLSSCSNLADHLPSPPDPVSVELLPVAPPIIWPYTFIIDGVSVSPSDSPLLLRAGDTLFNEAKAINPGTINVDLMASISSAYISHVDVVVVKPQPPYLPLVVGAATLLSRDLAIPPYFSSDTATLGVQILHADAQHPCPISTAPSPIASGAQLNVVDDGCLTNTGRLLRDAALVDVANFVSETPAGTAKEYGFPLSTIVHDCFGTSLPMQIGGVNISVSPGPAGKINGVLGLSFMTAGVIVPLAPQAETEDAPTWQGLMQSRLGALNPVRAGNPTESACSPHIQ